jgi:acetyl esterase/lipase
MTLSSGEYFKLWSGEAPGALPETIAAPEPTGHTPTLQVYLPTSGTATGASIVICPGGGYRRLADHEGPTIAAWLASYGITTFVLRYRLGPIYNYPTQLTDVRRGLRYVRAHVADWQLDPARIGVLGFSAGGHLTSQAATRFTVGESDAVDPIERVSSRPDLQILIYPVISFNLTYQPVNALLAEDPQPEQDLLDKLSSELHVCSDTPPAFLVHSTEDITVVVENSDRYAASLAAAGIPYEYVRGSIGGHGFGLTEDWSTRCIDWLRQQQFAR